MNLKLQGRKRYSHIKSEEQDDVDPTIFCNAVGADQLSARLQTWERTPLTGRPYAYHVLYDIIPQGLPAGEAVARSPGGLFPQGSPKENP